MNTYRITYYDKYRQTHTADVPADDVQSAITALEDGLNEQVEVKKIDILEDES